jgi:hypothetical protein
MNMMSESQNNIDSSPNPAVNNMRRAEVDGGIALDELPVGAVLEADTQHRTYRLENRGDGKVLISGHPEYCPEPVLVEYYGATDGTQLLKFWLVEPGLRMEFRHPAFGLLKTSKVRAIRELAPAGSVM